MLTDADYGAYVDFMSALRRQPRTKPHRLAVENYTLSGCEYFFTICAHDRRAWPFRNPKLAQGVVDALIETRRRRGWKLYAYCLMPDHLHFVSAYAVDQIDQHNAGFRGIVPVSMLDDVGGFKRFTTTQVWWKLGKRGRLWQRSSYDRVIRHNDSPMAAIRYVLNNPVRAGYVNDWREYPYAGIVDAPL